ncbi:Protein of unknown function [Photorhabdus luminescens]|uniref:DUF551 domain-containing protein n=2 Tax=Morganellaceae TaxID=1903414 RepID=A0A1G5RD66_PHOLU|nr:Protein of unknown function [Photorhabdus luminescens]
MGKMTFVVEYADGKEPTFSINTNILGGRPVIISLGDRVTPEWISIEDALPGERIGSNTLLVTDAQGFVTCDRFNHRVGDFEENRSNVTHWMELPESPEEVSNVL